MSCKHTSYVGDGRSSTLCSRSARLAEVERNVGEAWRQRRQLVQRPPAVLLDLIDDRERLEQVNATSLHEEDPAFDRAVGSGQVGDERRDVGWVHRIKTVARRMSRCLRRV